MTPEGRGPGPLDDARDVADEVEEELRVHFEGTVELLMERGWSEDEARAEARRRFGDVDRWRRTLEGMGRRRLRRRRVRRAARALVSTLASAGRSLRRSPGLSAAVVVTLALGIGANAAVFRTVDRLLLSPPDRIERPSEVRRLYQRVVPDDGETYAMEAFTYGDVTALRTAGLPARFAAAVVGMPETLGQGEGALRVRMARADSAYLPLLGVDAVLGRRFAPDDHRPDALPVALLSYALWTSRFGSDPGVLGRTVRVGEGRFEVVGVLPEGFVGAEPPGIDAWVPLEATAPSLWHPGWVGDERILAFHVVLRLQEGASAEVLARDALDVLARSRGEDYGLRGELGSVGTASLVPGDGPEPGPMISVSRWLAGVALLVLLVACANVANLFLAQGERVRRETAVRRALGAGRGRLGAELLARALLLALLGAAGAVSLATWGGAVLDDLFLAGMELGARPRNSRLLLFVTAAALLSATLSGLLPALRAPGGDLRRGMNAGGRSATGTGRLRRTLVGIQAGLSAILLVGALLFVMSLRSALRLDLGFDHERLVMVRLEQEEGAGSAALYAAAEDALLAAPGVESVTSTVAVPFVLLYGLQARLPEQDPVPMFTVNAVGRRYFATMGIPLLRGRRIERSDLAEGAEPVVVVSPSAAARLWPGEDPLGRCLVVGRGEAGCARVVGVAAGHAGTSLAFQGGIRRGSLSEIEDPMMAWTPLPVAGRTSPSALLVRTEGAAPAAVERVRRTALTVPGVRFAEVEAMGTFVDRQSRSWRLGAAVFSLFGAIALGVAAVGLYGVLAYEVARRRREIGIRMALGARRRGVVGRVIVVALATVAAGLVVALPVAVLGARRLGSLLFDVSPRDPTVYGLTAALLLVTAALAAALPAWRATRVDPREALVEG